MSEQQNISKLLEDQCDRLFANMVDARLLNAAEAGDDSEALVAAVDELGLSLALVPDSAGGSGLQWADIGGVFETIGYHAAPVLLGESIIAQWAVATANLVGGRAGLGLADGILRHDEKAGLSGSCVVARSKSVKRIVAVASSAMGPLLCILDPTAGVAEEMVTIGRDPRSRVTFNGVLPLASALCDFGGYGLEPYLAVLRAAQISGALSRMLSLSIDYGNTRVQFGRPIGKFQAIQHMIAELAGEAAAAKAGVQLALRGFDAGNGFEPAAIAKIRASIAAGKGSAAAHAVHGAIGVTEEHMLHHYTRRVWQWRADAGDEHVWSERLGRTVLEDEGAALWPRLVTLSDC
jgi:acyl-CoA dehydrogenase